METLSALLVICAGNSPVTVEFPDKGQWRGALMFPLTRAWINGWVNNPKTGDLRRHRTHYYVTIMAHVDQICPDDTELLPEQMLTSNQRDFVAVTRWHFPSKCSRNELIKCVWKLKMGYSSCSHRLWTQPENVLVHILWNCFYTEGKEQSQGNTKPPENQRYSVFDAWLIFIKRMRHFKEKLDIRPNMA